MKENIYHLYVEDGPGPYSNLIPLCGAHVPEVTWNKGSNCPECRDIQDYNYGKIAAWGKSPDEIRALIQDAKERNLPAGRIRAFEMYLT